MSKEIIEVLLVEDNLADVVMLQDALDRDALVTFQLTHAERLSQGMEQLQEQHFGAILLDLGLPDSQGLATFEQVHRQAPDLPVVVMSGLMDEQVAVQAVQAGAQDYLVKGPSGWEAVARAVRYAIERRQAQAALSASEQRFRALIEHNADAIVLVSADGALFYASPAVMRILGYSPEELVGSNIFALLHPDDLAFGAETFRQVLQQPGLPITGQVRHRHKNGTWRWVEATATNHLHEPGVRAIVGNFRDITERKLAVQALEQREQHLGTILRTAMDGFWLLDLQGRFVEVNDAYCAMSGYTREELLQRSIPDVEYVETDQETADHIQRIQRTGSDRFETRHRRKDGQVIDVEMSVKYLDHDGGRMVCFCRDITEQKRVEAELRKNAEHMAMAQRVGHFGSWETLFTSDLEYVEPHLWSDECYRIFGFEPRSVEITTNFYQSCVHPDDYQTVEQIVSKAIRNREECSLEYRIIRPDGTIRYIYEHGNVFLDKRTGQPVKIGGMVYDITERRQAEQALRESERQMRALVTSLDDIVFEFDQQGTYLNIWASDESLLARPRKELPGRLIKDVLGEDVARPFTDGFKRVLESGQPENIEYPLPISGELRWFQAHVSAIPSEEGPSRTVSLIARDITERKRVEEALIESEERYRSLFENMLEGYAYCRMIFEHGEPQDFVYIEVNQAFEELTGLKNVTGKKVSQVIPGIQQTNPELFQIYGRVALTGKPERFETYLASLGIWFSISVYCPGKEHFVAIFDNVTDRKRAEEALALSERKFRGLFENAAVGMFRASIDGTAIFDVNAKVCEFLGISRDALLASPDAIELEDAQEWDRIYALLKDRGRITDYEARVKTAYGVKTCLFSMTLYPRDGVLEGTALDITDRKRADDEIRKRTEELALLLEAGRELSSALDLRDIYDVLYQFIARTVPCDALIVSSFDRETELIRCLYLRDSQGESDISAFPPIPLEPEGQGTQSRVIRSGQSLLLPDYEAQRKTSATKYYANGQGNLVDEIPEDADRPRSAILVPLTMEGRVAGVMQIFSNRLNAHTEDHLRFVEALVFRVTAAMSNAVLFQRVQTELVERRRAEEEIRKLNVELEQRVTERTADLSRANTELAQTARTKDEFLASMSHELRTPLSAILTLAESLEEGTYGPLNDRQLKPLRTVAESGHHLLNLINDILDLSKIEAGKLELQISPIEVEPLCQASLRLVKQLAQKKRLQVALDVDRAVTSLRADGRYLKQMLVNLLSNAVKFTPEGGQIGLEVRGDAGQGVAHFTVWDTGIGIARENTQRLFKPFVQVDSGLARQYSGTGLGLSLVYRLAELHGGSVSLSSAPGKGSRFTVSLRWAGPGEPRGTGPLTPARAPNVRQALIVEDSPTAADQLARYLGELGARVTIYPAGESALHQAVEVQPEVILLDIQLPGLSGWEVLEQLKSDERTRNIPVIVITVVDEPGRGLALGAADYVVKPITRARLHEALWRALSPALDPGAQESSPAPLPAILIAEDNPANQATYSDYLSMKGYPIVLAANGAEAIERARQARPGLIIMDIQMPGMDGLEATRRLRADPELRAIPIIALTALAMPGDRERCLAAGANVYLTKPVSLKQLAQVIEVHLQRKGK